MRLLGLVGGSSYVSTVDYYNYINQLVNAQLGGNDFPQLVIYSVDYGELTRNSDAGRFPDNAHVVLNAAERLKAAGAEGILICANSLHAFCDAVTQETRLPVIHIAEATADAVAARGIDKVGLLGTNFTMKMEFFRDKLTARGIEIVIPGTEADCEIVHRAIFDEFGTGIFSDKTKAEYLRIIGDMQCRGAQGVILGCTEIPLLIKPEDVAIPTFDTTRIHAEAAAAFILI